MMLFPYIYDNIAFITIRVAFHPNFKFQLWIYSLQPSIRRVLSLVAKIKSLQKDKEHLTTNLRKAEEEVKFDWSPMFWTISFLWIVWLLIPCLTLPGFPRSIYCLMKTPYWTRRTKGYWRNTRKGTTLTRARNIPAAHLPRQVWFLN